MWDYLIEHDGEEMPGNVFASMRADEGQAMDDQTGDESVQRRPMSIGELVSKHPKLREPVIEGLLRQGETAGIHAKSKVGKSWLAYSIALNVATGYYLFGKHKCHRGNVLIIDYELHPENLAHRIPEVARAMNLPEWDYAETLDVVSMRGDMASIGGLVSFFNSLTKQYSLIIMDPLYRLLPAGISENDNAAMTQIFNLIDSYARETGAAFIFIHHQSKGDQSAKDVTDVGSGAGSIARAVDAHIVLRQHEEVNHVVLEAALRSFAPLEPLVLRWEFPLWKLAEGMDASALKGRKSAGEERQAAKDHEGMQLVLKAFPDSEIINRRQIRTKTGIGYDRLNKLIRGLIDSGSIELSQTTKAKNGSEIEWFRLTV